MNGNHTQDGQASPNPSYEQPVKSCGENVNILDEEWEQGAYSNVDGTSKIDSNQYVRTKNFSSIEPNKEYAFKGVVKSAIQISGDLLFYQEDGTFISRLGLSTPFTSPNNAKKIKVNFYNLNGIVPEDVDYAKLEQGNKATPWSPYGMGCVNEKASSKNKYIGADSITSNGVTFTKNDDGSYNIVGTATAEANAINFEYIKNIGLINGENYTFWVNQQLPEGVLILAEVYNGTTWKRHLVTGLTSLKQSGTATIDISDGTQIRYVLRVTNGKTVNISNLKIQLEPGTQATSYVPHEEQNKSIPTQQPMRSIGTVEDEFVLKNDGKWYERHWIGRKIFDNNTTIVDCIPWGNFYRAYTTISNAKTYENSMQHNQICSHFIYNNYGVFVQNSEETRIGIFGQYRDTQNFYFVTDKQNKEAFKSWAVTNNLCVDYILQEPTDILCTQEQSDILDSLTEDTVTYKGGTYITSPDEVKARIKVSGLYDLNKLLTRVETLESEV